MEWSFHYSGPKEPEMNYKCVTCLAGKTKECPTHGTRFENACAHCKAAQGGPCHGHWGIAAALDGHPVPADARGAADWKAAKAFALAELGELAPDKSRVLVKLRGDALEDPSGNVHREFHLEITAQ